MRASPWRSTILVRASGHGQHAGTPLGAQPGETPVREGARRREVRPMDSIPLIEQVKIQAQVLVPLVRTLQAELGEERANELVRRSLGALYRQFGDAWWRSQR